jgi:hypothetical protein
MQEHHGVEVRHDAVVAEGGLGGEGGNDTKGGQNLEVIGAFKGVVELSGLGTDTEIIEDGVTVLILELGRRAFLAEGGLDSFEVLVGFGGRRRVTTLQRTQQLADKILILHSLRALLLDIYMESLFEELLKRNGLLIPGWSGFPSYP